jgi:hypothetical protein
MNFNNKIIENFYNRAPCNNHNDCVSTDTYKYACTSTGCSVCRFTSESRLTSPGLIDNNFCESIDGFNPIDGECPDICNAPTPTTSPPPEITSTSPPPEITSTSPPPEIISTSPPPEITSTSPPPEITSTSPPPEIISTSPPPEITSTNPPPEITSTSPPPEPGIPQNLIFIIVVVLIFFILILIL